jgi:hypothetical protein
MMRRTMRWIQPFWSGVRRAADKRDELASPHEMALR